MVYNALCHQLLDYSLLISQRVAEMSPLIQYAVVSMLSGSVVALISMVAILGILVYQYRKRGILVVKKGLTESEALLRTKLEGA
jgi:hypothetical protein